MKRKEFQFYIFGDFVVSEFPVGRSISPTLTVSAKLVHSLVHSSAAKTAKLIHIVITNVAFRYEMLNKTKLKKKTIFARGTQSRQTTD